MLRSLDISLLFTTPVDQRPIGFYSRWRPYFYSNFDPSQFIVESVELELEYLLATEKHAADAVLLDSVGGIKGGDLKKSTKGGARKRAKVKVKGEAGKLSGAVKFDPQTVVYWLAEAKNILVASGGSLTPALVGKMVEFLRKAYSLSTKSREKAQLAYVLRTLGYNGGFGEDDSDEVYAVLMEFDSGGGPTMIYASSDSFACAYWHGDARKWSTFDKGEGSELVSRLCKVAYELLEKFPSVSQSGESSEGMDIPLLPTSETIVLSVVCSSGIRTISVDKTLIKETGFGGLYNGFSNLFRALVGKEFDHGRHGTSKFLNKTDLDEYPLKLDGVKQVNGLSPIIFRTIAFLVDIGLLSIVLALFFYFVSPIVNNWGLLPASTLYVLLGFSIPLILAWMESSPDWGHATLGKKLVGIHVHGVKAPHISYPQALTRNLSKLILGPMFLFSGYLWGIFHPYRRCWHDLLSDTLVMEGALQESLLEAYNELVQLRGAGVSKKHEDEEEGAEKLPPSKAGALVSWDRPKLTE